MAWFNQQYDEPSRSDYYLMQIAQEVRRVLSKNPSRVRLLDFKLPFGKTSTDKKVKEDISKKAISRWIGYFGGKVIRKYKYQ